uniref:Putative secreted protein n=1 Tax=Panstrongylus lignarius TaxID=156445 RepID=A0A224Y401_9HEMI
MIGKGQSFDTALVMVPVVVLIVATRGTLSMPGCRLTIPAKDHFNSGKFSHLTNTNDPGFTMLELVFPRRLLWDLDCNCPKYSLVHLLQN